MVVPTRLGGLNRGVGGSSGVSSSTGGGLGLQSRRLRLAATVLACATYPSDVLAWLDAQRVAWRPLELAGATGPVVVLFKGAADHGECALALHLLASPRRAADVRPAWSNARLTDACASHGSPSVLVHLHEDIWRSRGEIVRARLLARSGRVGARLFARSTTVRRIPAAEYIPFLDSNHLWGATKAKYGYGLFAKNTGELVAVATFSARRRVLRAGVPHASHELLRTCSRRDAAVVGGISKLVRAFVRAHGADDVVTVVDRDWGTAAGWHGMRFETVHLMPPLPMVVGLDGVRRHLVGAGLVPLEGAASMDGGSEAPLRASLPLRVMQGLSSFDAAEHDPRSPLAWLVENEMYPLHDAGVERLMMLTHGGGGKGGAAEPGAALAAWDQSVPTYATEHYSSNPGVAALLVAAARRPAGGGGSGALPAAALPAAARAAGGGADGGCEGGGEGGVDGGVEGGGGGSGGSLTTSGEDGSGGDASTNAALPPPVLLDDSLTTSGEDGSGGSAPTDVALPPPILLDDVALPPPVLLDDVALPPPVLLDEPSVREAMESWKAATAGGEGAARLVFSQASAMGEEEGPAMGGTQVPTALMAAVDTGAGEAAPNESGARIHESGARIEDVFAQASTLREEEGPAMRGTEVPTALMAAVDTGALLFSQASAMREEEIPTMGGTDVPTARMAAGEAAPDESGARIHETGARIEVHERPGGWRTLRVVNGKRHVLQSVVRLRPDASADPSAVLSEYLRAMVALAFAALEQTPVATHHDAGGMPPSVQTILAALDKTLVANSPSSTRHDTGGVPPPVQKTFAALDQTLVANSPSPTRHDTGGVPPHVQKISASLDQTPVANIPSSTRDTGGAPQLVQKVSTSLDQTPVANSPSSTRHDTGGVPPPVQKISASLEQTPVANSPSSTRDTGGAPQLVMKVSVQRTLQTDTLKDKTPPPVGDQRPSGADADALQHFERYVCTYITSCMYIPILYKSARRPWHIPCC